MPSHFRWLDTTLKYGVFLLVPLTIPALLRQLVAGLFLALSGGCFQHALGTAGTDTSVVLTYLDTVGSNKFVDVLLLIQE